MQSLHQLVHTALFLPSEMFNCIPQCMGRVEYPMVPVLLFGNYGVINRAYSFLQAPSKPEGLGGVVDLVQCFDTEFFRYLFFITTLFATSSSSFLLFCWQCRKAVAKNIYIFSLACTKFLPFCHRTFSFPKLFLLYHKREISDFFFTKTLSSRIQVTENSRLWS